jgi:hypothetical protein
VSDDHDALSDLADRPNIPDPRDYSDPEMRSFHEAVCDLARQFAMHPERYGAVPAQIAVRLNTINEIVEGLVREIVWRSVDY